MSSYDLRPCYTNEVGDNCTQEVLLEKLEKLNYNCPGPDLIDSRVVACVHICTNSDNRLLQPLEILFNAFLSKGRLIRLKA